MPAFTWTPDKNLAKTTTPRVVGVKFGDGFEQRTGDGINTINSDYALAFTLRTRAEIDAIDDFLEARGGAEAFDWTDPRGRAIKVVCQSWTPVYDHDLNSALTCTFRRVYEA
jgi:phage-related protein